MLAQVTLARILNPLMTGSAKMVKINPGKLFSFSTAYLKPQRRYYSQSSKDLSSSESFYAWMKPEKPFEPIQPEKRHPVLDAIYHWGLQMDDHIGREIFLNMNVKLFPAKVNSVALVSACKVQHPEFFTHLASQHLAIIEEETIKEKTNKTLTPREIAILSQHMLEGYSKYGMHAEAARLFYSLKFAKYLSPTFVITYIEYASRITMGLTNLKAVTVEAQFEEICLADEDTIDVCMPKLMMCAVHSALPEDSIEDFLLPYLSRLPFTGSNTIFHIIKLWSFRNISDQFIVPFMTTLRRTHQLDASHVYRLMYTANKLNKYRLTLEFLDYLQSGDVHPWHNRSKAYLMAMRASHKTGKHDLLMHYFGLLQHETDDREALLSAICKHPCAHVTNYLSSLDLSAFASQPELAKSITFALLASPVQLARFVTLCSPYDHFPTILSTIVAHIRRTTMIIDPKEAVSTFLRPYMSEAEYSEIMHHINRTTM